MQVLEEQLIDTQCSLSAALARIETYRLRHARKEKENVLLRTLLRKNGINPADASEGEDEIDATTTEALTTDDPNDPVASETPKIQETLSYEGERLAALLQQVQPHEVKLYSETGQVVQGNVFISDDALEFIEVKTRVVPSAFVGVRFCSGAPVRQQEDVPHKQSTKKQTPDKATWWESMFGSSHSEDSFPSNPPSQAPNLKRHSGARSVISKVRSYTNFSNMSSSSSTSSNRNSPVGIRTPTRTQRAVPDLRRQSAPVHTSRETIQSPGPSLSSLANLTDYLQSSLIKGLLGDDPESSLSGEGEHLVQRNPLPAENTGEGVWQVMWKDCGKVNALVFQASWETRMQIQAKIEQWGDHSASAAALTQEGVPDAEKPREVPDSPFILAVPQHLVPSNSYTPPSTSESTIITLQMASAVSAALPGRLRITDWTLLYSTEKNGFSLSTMYRNAARCSRSVLVVEDFSGFVFGAFLTSPWRVNPRYQGTGESFVFQLYPHLIQYPWQQGMAGKQRNDFFSLLAPDSLGIGGGPQFAVWLDSDLLYGHSGACNTFGCCLLAGSEHFKIKGLELWQVGK